MAGSWHGEAHAKSAGESPQAAETEEATSAPAPATGAQGPREAEAHDTAAIEEPNATESPSSDGNDNAARARRLFERAATAFAEKRNMAAIYLFRQAAELMPDARFSYNLGLAYEEMGHTGEALAAYREYLRDTQDGPESSDVGGRVKALEKQLAAVGLQQLSVQTEPPEAVVYVDGVARGVSPLRLEIPPGTHELRIHKPLFEEQRVWVELSPDHASNVRQTLVAEPPEASETKPGPSIQPLTWALLGVGAAGLVGGVSFEMSRASLAKRAGDTDNGERAASLRGEARGKKTASLSLLGFGSGLLVAGGVLALSDWSDEDPRPGDLILSGYWDRDGAGLSAALDF